MYYQSGKLNGCGFGLFSFCYMCIVHSAITLQEKRHPLPQKLPFVAIKDSFLKVVFNDDKHIAAKD